MIASFLFASLILSFAVCSGLSFYLWSARRSSLHRMVLITQIFYALWAFTVLMTALVPDLESKIFFTQLRQLYLPFLVPLWVSIALALFYRPLADRMGAWKNLIFVIPSFVVAGHFCSIVGFSFASKWTFYDFALKDGNLGLLSFKLGPVIQFGYSYIGICLLLLYVLYVGAIIAKKGAKRKYALLLALAGVLAVALEVLGRVWQVSYMVQASVATTWPAVLALYYAVSKMEFLDIGALAHMKVFESLPSPVLIFDGRGNFWNANNGAYEVFGITPAMIGTSGWRIEPLAPLFKKTEFVEINGQNYKVVKHELEIQGGDEVASVYILSDVTELLESNETLRELNEQVLKLIRFNQKIHTVLSHDLSGSLASVRILLNGMKIQFDQKQDTKSSKDLEPLIAASQSSLELLQDVLVWSQDGESSLRANLKDCVHAGLSHVSAQVHAKGVRIKEDMSSEDIYLRGSSKVIEAISRNLLSNAIKFSPQDGVVQVSIFHKGDRAELVVEDQGVGMSSEHVALILSGAAHQSFAVPHGGFGMGLKFTLSFVEQLGGEMKIQSELGKGSRFIVSLPTA